jgi:hypothetical protein
MTADVPIRHRSSRGPKLTLMRPSIGAIQTVTFRWNATGQGLVKSQLENVVMETQKKL